MSKKSSKTTAPKATKAGGKKAKPEATPVGEQAIAAAPAAGAAPLTSAALASVACCLVSYGPCSVPSALATTQNRPLASFLICRAGWPFVLLAALALVVVFLDMVELLNRNADGNCHRQARSIDRVRHSYLCSRNTSSAAVQNSEQSFP